MGLKSPALAWIFALLGGMGVLFTTPFTQPNSVAVAVASQLEQHELTLGSLHTLADLEIDGDHLTIGIVLAVLTWLVIVRGVKAIGRAAEKLSPLKVGLYLIGGAHRDRHAHRETARRAGAWFFSEAFSPHAAAGGAAGLYGDDSAIRYGVAAACTRTKPATARRPSRTARRRASAPSSRDWPR